MPFGLKNAPAIFCKIVVAAFKDFIWKFLAIYMDYWTVYRLVKDHLTNLWLMLERCWQHQIMLDSYKCILCAPFGIMLGHIVYKEGILVDATKIRIIVNLSPLRNANQLRVTLGHTRYYYKFIRRYQAITTPMLKLLNKDVKFESRD